MSQIDVLWVAHSICLELPIGTGVIGFFISFIHILVLYSRFGQS